MCRSHWEEYKCGGAPREIARIWCEKQNRNEPFHKHDHECKLKARCREERAMMERATRQRDYFLSAPQVEQRSNFEEQLEGQMRSSRDASLARYRKLRQPPYLNTEYGWRPYLG